MRRPSPTAALASLALAFVLSAAPAAAQAPPSGPQTAGDQAALAYYAQHYPAYYQRYYGSLAPPSSPIAPPPLPSPRPLTEDDPAPPPREAGMADETADQGARTLRGHTFHYPRLMDSAFVATNLYAGTAVELYHQPGVSSTYETASGVTQAKEYDRDLVFLRLLYGFDYALGEQVAIGLDADYLAEVGANGDSLLLRGGQTGFLFRPNLTVRVYRDADSGTQLALIGHGSFGAGIRAVPQGMLAALSDAIDSIADDPSGARSQCLAAGDLDCALGDGASVGDATKLTRRRYGGGGTAVWAQAMGRVLGFQVALGAEGARENISTALAGDVGATQVAAHAGFAPALNFAPSFPLGLTLEYRVELNHSRYSGNATVGIRDGAQTLGVNHRLGGGAYYTGRRDLLLGWTAGVAFLQDVDSSVIEAAASRATTLGGEPMEQPRAIVGSAQFEMRYFF